MKTLQYLNLMMKIITTAPGQACVFYLKNQVLGGGWIVKTLN